METTICGLADGLYFLALVSKYFCDTPLSLTNVDEETYRNETSIASHLYPNPFQRSITLLISLTQESTAYALLNSKGEMIVPSSPIPSSETITISDEFSKGLCVLLLYYPYTVKTLKIMKE